MALLTQYPHIVLLWLSNHSARRETSHNKRCILSHQLSLYNSKLLFFHSYKLLLSVMGGVSAARVYILLYPYPEKHTNSFCLAESAPVRVVHVVQPCRFSFFVCFFCFFSVCHGDYLRLVLGFALCSLFLIILYHT